MSLWCIQHSPLVSHGPSQALTHLCHCTNGSHNTEQLNTWAVNLNCTATESYCALHLLILYLFCHHSVHLQTLALFGHLWTYLLSKWHTSLPYLVTVYISLCYSYSRTAQCLAPFASNFCLRASFPQSLLNKIQLL